jgi:SAM-dependent methyltransferase
MESMPSSNSNSPADRPADAEGDARTWDSQCWFPPLELAALVAAGVLPASVPVLDVGCGAGVEAVFLALRGWPAYGIDKDRSLVEKATALARRHRVPPRFHLMDVMWGASALPRGWPAQYGVILDRFCVNNVVAGDVPESDYYGVIATLVEPGGLFILRDRGDEDEAESTFRRRLFDAGDDAKLPGGAGEFFELVPGGRVLDVRLVGDDTPDWNRLDAMVPIRGQLAVLRRKRGGRR